MEAFCLSLVHNVIQRDALIRFSEEALVVLRWRQHSLDVFHRGVRDRRVWSLQSDTLFILSMTDVLLCETESVGGSRVFTSFFGEIIDDIKYVAMLLCFMMITETDHFTLSGHITSHCSRAGKYSRAEWEESMFLRLG